MATSGLSEYYIIERHTDAGFMDCFVDTEAGFGDHVAHHFGDIDCRRPFDPQLGYLFESKEQAERAAAELNSSGGLGAKAVQGRYIAVRYRNEPAVKSYEIETITDDGEEPKLVWVATYPGDDQPARFAERAKAESVAQSFAEIETTGRTFIVSPSSEPPTPNLSGRIIEA